MIIKKLKDKIFKRQCAFCKRFIPIENLNNNFGECKKLSIIIKQDELENLKECYIYPYKIVIDKKEKRSLIVGKNFSCKYFIKK